MDCHSPVFLLIRSVRFVRISNYFFNNNEESEILKQFWNLSGSVTIHISLYFFIILINKLYVTEVWDLYDY